jgi:hypothetical protein
MLDQAATLRPEFEAAFAKLKDIPTDIAPRFVTAERLVPSRPAKAKTPATKKQPG